MTKCIKCRKEIGKTSHKYCYDCYFAWKDKKEKEQKGIQSSNA